MEEKDKDIDFNFTPQVGLGRILFFFSKEEEVSAVLGNSAERSIGIFSDNEYVIHLDY